MKKGGCVGYFSSRRGERESWDLSDSIGTGKQCVDLGVYLKMEQIGFQCTQWGWGRKTNLSNWVNKDATS